MTPHAIATLDNMEGPAYDRVSREIELYNGERLSALIFVQSQSYAKYPLAEGLPSKRYLKLLIHGARRANLDALWIESLEQHSFIGMPTLTLTTEHQHQLAARTFDSSDFDRPTHAVINNNPEGIDSEQLFALQGVVLRALPALDPFFRKLFFGDVTLLMCGFVSYDPKPSTVAEATPDQLDFLQGTLQQLLSQGCCEIVGHCLPCPFLLKN
eukprot:c5088_g1_i1.p1 GENE.c5088_g1_i1~~c5088_g1_i1.p1  ORF type:complete len:212 (+),score=41.58 c5088_g1_i1:417-1052(+)